MTSFTCNICGSPSHLPVDDNERNRPTCTVCGSSSRLRSVILALSRAVFARDLILTDFPVLNSVRGLGVSDSPSYADLLARRFQYTNTFYDRKPFFDLSNPDPGEFGRYDFVTCSEVIEHVRPPVETAFHTLAKLLKPSGVLILTVPYSVGLETKEHFPALRDSVFTEIAGRPVLINRRDDGRYEVFDELKFHGGQGATLEMRVLCEIDIRAHLTAAGFASIRFETKGSPEFGVVLSNPCSLPVTASRQPFSLDSAAIGELTGQLADIRRHIRKSKWLRLGRRLGLGPDFRIKGGPAK